MDVEQPDWFARTLAHAPERANLSVNTGPFGETIANEIRPTASAAS